MPTKCLIFLGFAFILSACNPYRSPCAWYDNCTSPCYQSCSEHNEMYTPRCQAIFHNIGAGHFAPLDPAHTCGADTVPATYNFFAYDTIPVTTTYAAPSARIAYK